MNDLPEEFKPKPLPSIEVAVTDEPHGVVIDDNKSSEISKTTGAILLTRSMVREIEALGATVDNAGVIRVANGMALLSHKAIAECIMKISEKIANGEDVIKLSHALGYISQAMTKNNAQMVKAAQANIAATAHARRPTGFLPGQAVQVNAAPGSTVNVGKA